VSGNRPETILRFIEGFTAEHGYSPTIRQIGEAAEISSTAVVHWHLRALVRKGALVHTPRGYMLPPSVSVRAQ
jgi:SOS-response transcriptional repressor LexA